MDISVVVPVLNEEESLPLPAPSLTEVLAESGYSYEIIIVDDGSTDRSFEIMQELQAQDEHLRRGALSAQLWPDGSLCCRV